MLRVEPPLLQNNRSFSNDSNIVELSLDLLCPLTAISIALLHPRTISSYLACSEGVRYNLRISGIGSGKFSSALVLRRQVAPRSILKFEKRSLELDIDWFVICLRNVGAFSRIGTFRNVTRAPRSSRLFWIGVPVRHQRWSASRLAIAWNCFVDLFLTSWPRWHVKFTVETELRTQVVAYFRPKQSWTIWLSPGHSSHDKTLMRLLRKLWALCRWNKVCGHLILFPDRDAYEKWDRLGMYAFRRCWV